MKVLIVYATVEGQTGKIARFLQDRLTEAGHAVTLADAGDRTAQIDVLAADKVILAASVHQRRHPEAFEVFVTGAKADLAQRPTLMISVSLKAAFPEGQEEAQDYLAEMKMRTGLAPDAELLVAGAVQALSYDYFETQVLRFVVLDGQDFDPEDGPHEFTDWGRLDADVTAFIAA